MNHLDNGVDYQKLGHVIDQTNDMLAMTPVLKEYPELIQGLEQTKLLMLIRFSASGITHTENLKKLLTYFIAQGEIDSQNTSAVPQLLFSEALLKYGQKLPQDEWNQIMEINLKPIIHRQGAISRDQDAETYILRLLMDRIGDVRIVWKFYLDCCQQEITPDEFLHMALNYDPEQPLSWNRILARGELAITP